MGILWLHCRACINGHFTASSDVCLQRNGSGLNRICREIWRVSLPTDRKVNLKELDDYLCVDCTNLYFKHKIHHTHYYQNFENYRKGTWGLQQGAMANRLYALLGAPLHRQPGRLRRVLFSQWRDPFLFFSILWAYWCSTRVCLCPAINLFRWGFMQV